jgi:hypothetical protein
MRIILTILLCLLLVKFLIKKTTPLKASLFGMGLMFCIISPTCYYWSMLAFLPLLGIENTHDPEKITLITLFANLLMYLWIPLYFILLYYQILTRISVALFYPQILIVGIVTGIVLTRKGT